MAAMEGEQLAGTSKLSTKEKIEQGIALKAKGNEYFKKKAYRDAMKSYHKALLHVKGLIDQPSLPGLDAGEKDISDEDKEQIFQVQFSCYNNLAGILMKFVTCVEYLLLALKIQPQNAKALFRRGQSYFHMKDFEKAQRDLKAAEKLESKDPSIKKMLVSLDVELKKIREKEKKIYAGMFDKHKSE